MVVTQPSETLRHFASVDTLAEKKALRVTIWGFFWSKDSTKCVNVGEYLYNEMFLSSSAVRLLDQHSLPVRISSLVSSFYSYQMLTTLVLTTVSVSF